MTEAQKARLIVLEVVESLLDGGDTTLNAAKLLMVEKIIGEYATKEEREAQEMDRYYSEMEWENDFWMDKHQLATENN